MLSHEFKRVVDYTFLVDFRGTGFGHRKVLPLVKEVTAGDAIECGWAPSSVWFVGMNAIAMSLVGFGLKTFCKDGPSTPTVLSSTPFQTSASFRSNFLPNTVPADIGGDLRLGEDGHCCVGAYPPGLVDTVAVFKFASESSSINEQLTIRCDKTMAHLGKTTEALLPPTALELIEDLRSGNMKPRE